MLSRIVRVERGVASQSTCCVRLKDDARRGKRRKKPEGATATFTRQWPSLSFRVEARDFFWHQKHPVCLETLQKESPKQHRQGIKFKREEKIIKILFTNADAHLESMGGLGQCMWSNVSCQSLPAIRV